MVYARCSEGSLFRNKKGKVRYSEIKKGARCSKSSLFRNKKVLIVQKFR